MGNSHSVEFQYVKLLKQLLQSSGVKVKQESFDELFALVRKHCYWFRPTGHNQLNLEVWKQVMRALRRAHQHGDPISVRVWSLCKLISLSLEPLQSETESDYGARPQRPNSAPDPSAAFRTLFRESPIEDFPPPPPPLVSETGEDFSDSSDEGAFSDGNKDREQASKQNEMPLPQQNEISDILSKLKNLMTKLEENKSNTTTPSYQEPCPTIPSAPPLELAAYPVGASRQFRFPLKPESNRLLLKEEMNKQEKQYSKSFFAFPIVGQAMPANDQFPNGYVNVEYNHHDIKIF
uniref:Endogenous retrovirus group K member 19 Gag polyprotein-like n=1 Tax=Tursiops truncatus TaxID=9739 RepID=A0A6J3RGZ1_TURTR|nr:endogenous retrovirus group K member 19 Gag polyprotein-like [Tursiops truncatus]